MANEQQSDLVQVTINGAAVSVPPGTRIIEAAEQAGIGIAHYCYHPGLSAPAMCRMCLVEVEGAPKLAPACVTTVAPGQVILTESARARVGDLRRSVGDGGSERHGRSVGAEPKR